MSPREREHLQFLAKVKELGAPPSPHALRGKRSFLPAVLTQVLRRVKLLMCISVDGVELLVNAMVKKLNDEQGHEATERRQVYTFLDLGIKLKDGQRGNLWNTFLRAKANGGRC